MEGFARRCLLVLAALAACSTAVRSARYPLPELAQPLASADGVNRTRNDRPLIGILSEPGSPGPKGGSYIAASHIKFVESAGGRPVPIQYDLPYDEMTERVGMINGVLLPGGSASLKPNHPFFNAVSHLLNLTLAANDGGEHYPLHGTCLGFEALAVVVSGDKHSPLGHFNSEDNPAPLILTEDAAGSPFFDALPPKVLDNLQALPLAMENHQAGLARSTLENHPKLSKFFKVTAMAADRDGEQYVANMEARNYPITATQWHPEKNAFEFADFLHIPHSPEAVEVTHAVAMFLVGEARKNSRRPPSLQAEADLLIYNYAPLYTGHDLSEDFVQAYVFKGQGGGAVQS